MKKVTLIFAFVAFLSYIGISQTLTWRFANYEVINAGTQLQFDVQVKGDGSTTYHRDLQVYFDYNTAGFGTDWVAGGHVTVTPLSLMDNYYSIVNTVDNTSSKIAIITEADNEMSQVGGAGGFNLMPGTFTGLFTVTMDISDNTALAGIDFDAALMDGGQYYQSESVIEPVKYADPCLYDNDLNSLLLSSADGTITYANATNQVLDNCTVTLKLGGSTVSTVSNHSDGYYSFTGVADGSYTIETSCSNARGGSDVLDLNMIRDYILGSITYNNLQFLASDVDLNAIVNVVDYNLIRDVILGAASGWPAPDYVFEIQSVTVSGGYGGPINYQGLCTGDPNGSYTW